jgi:hypothetical protein
LWVVGLGLGFFGMFISFLFISTYTKGGLDYNINNKNKHASAGQIEWFYTSKSPNWYSLTAAFYFVIFCMFSIHVRVT